MTSPLEVKGGSAKRWQRMTWWQRVGGLVRWKNIDVNPKSKLIDWFYSPYVGNILKLNIQKASELNRNFKDPTLLFCSNYFCRNLRIQRGEGVALTPYPLPTTLRHVTCSLITKGQYYKEVLIPILLWCFLILMGKSLRMAFYKQHRSPLTLLFNTMKVKNYPNWKTVSQTILHDYFKTRDPIDFSNLFSIMTRCGQLFRFHLTAGGAKHVCAWLPSVSFHQNNCVYTIACCFFLSKIYHPRWR